MFQTTIALILFLFPLAYSPGPEIIFFAVNGAWFGFLSTVPAIVSYQIAIWALTAAISAGFIATFDKFPQVFVTLKVLGSLYLL